ncbi:amino acid permease [Streptomyces sp. GbtcB6]|uniref:amino acid permease n=1 Tax=Streptomyces sp. GbtcB6 TaxID=2824751 RepID=UPI001C2FDC02|nr:amino acid permease [Streptomyces sp. GbtcB6]
MSEPDTDGGALKSQGLGLMAVLFQSIAFMGPAAAVAFALGIAIPSAGAALPLAVCLAAVTCVLVGICIGQLAKHVTSAGGIYAFVSVGMGERVGFVAGWLLTIFTALWVPGAAILFAVVTQNAVGHYFDVDWGWEIWFLIDLMVLILMNLKGVRISTYAGVVLGLLEMVIFAALATVVIVRSHGGAGLGAFTPRNSADGEIRSLLIGVVFAVFAFIGFESSAALGEEAADPRRTVAKASWTAALVVGGFFMLCSYALVSGFGVHGFVDSVTASPDPWADLAHTDVGSFGTLLVFLALLNSTLAVSNAAVVGTTRVLFTMARGRMLPKPLARVSGRAGTPDTAMLASVGCAAAVGLAVGRAYQPLVAFAAFGTALTISYVVLYILVCCSVIRYFRSRRAEFSRGLHLVVPVVAIVLFVFPLYYLYVPLPEAPGLYSAIAVPAVIVVSAVAAQTLHSRRPDLIARSQNVFGDRMPEHWEAYRADGLPDAVVVIGGGTAGFTVCATLRSIGFTGAVTLIEREPTVHDRPPLTKEFLLGRLSAQDLTLQSPQWFVDHDITVLRSAEVVSVDPQSAAVHLADGSTLNAPALVLATGGTARTLPVPGGGHARTVRTLADAERIRGLLVPGAAVVVVGGGLIGAELASSAESLGCDVTLVEPVDVPMERAWGPVVAGRAHAEHGRHGVRAVRAGVESIVARSQGYVVHLSDGTSLVADVVLAGVGLVVGDQLARRAGIDVRDGVLVDVRRRTSAAGVWAVGDVCRVADADGLPQASAEHWEAAQTDGIIAAHDIMRLDLPASVSRAPWFWSDRYGQRVEVAGRMDPDALHIRRGVSDMSFSVFALDGARCVGVAAINDPRTVRFARRLIDQHIPVDPTRLADPDVPIEDLVRRRASAGKHLRSKERQ